MLSSLKSSSVPLKNRLAVLDSYQYQNADMLMHYNYEFFVVAEQAIEFHIVVKLLSI
jgi:hypothetical protein